MGLIKSHKTTQLKDESEQATSHGFTKKEDVDTSSFSVCLPFLLRLLADVGQNASVDIQYVTIDSVRGMRGEEHGGTAQFAGVEPAACGRLGTDE